MKKKKLERGEYGYFIEKKRKSLFGTFLMVFIGIAIFVISAVLSLITFNRTSATKNEGAFQ